MSAGRNKNAKTAVRKAQQARAAANRDVRHEKLKLARKLDRLKTPNDKINRRHTVLDKRAGAAASA